MPKHILIVEDEMLIALDIETTLAEYGHTTLTAGTIGAAQEAIRTEQFDLAILDLHLKDGSSIPVAKLLRQKRIPFVLCSGSTVGELAEVFRDVPYIPKPYYSTELVSVIDSLPTTH